MKKIILNLGCGITKIPNSIGVDKIKIKKFTDVVHDLDKAPYPFKNNYADEIHCYHVLEHLHNPLEKIEEMHRILKPGGILYLRVPHFSSMGAFTDITHIRPFACESFNCFEDNHAQNYYTKARFKIIHKEIKYFGLYPNKGMYEKFVHKNQCFFLLKPAVRIINFFIKLSPILFERIWCYWVGGATEIVFLLQKI